MAQSSKAQEYISSLCSTLNNSGVPCVLWGYLLLNVYGIPSGGSSIDFVVPNEQMNDAIKALAARVGELEACPNSESCYSGSYSRHTPPPDFHFHMVGRAGTTVGLYPQSDTLWFLPPLSEILPCTLGRPFLDATSPFISATDATLLPPWRPGRGSGLFLATNQSQHVCVPRAAVTLEALMRIHARDSGKRVGSFSLTMVYYMIMYVDEDGFLDATSLPDPLRDFYIRLKADEMSPPVRVWIRELKEALGVPCEDER